MRTDTDQQPKLSRDWVPPQLEKLGTMQDVAASLNAPGNGASANGTNPPPS